MNHAALSVPFVSGILVAGYAIIALYFLRFWRDTRDRLFVLFAGAFAVLATQRMGLTFVTQGSHHSTWMYLLRLIAFGLILFAIIDKNRR
jgi:hypothetical protein